MNHPRVLYTRYGDRARSERRRSQALHVRLPGMDGGVCSGAPTIVDRRHRVDDDAIDEDACQIRSGSAPRTRAACRNLILTLPRREGAANIAALRTDAGRLDRAVQVIAPAGVMKCPCPCRRVRGVCLGTSDHVSTSRFGGWPVRETLRGLLHAPVAPRAHRPVATVVIARRPGRVRECRSVVVRSRITPGAPGPAVAGGTTPPYRILPDSDQPAAPPYYRLIAAGRAASGSVPVISARSSSASCSVVRPR